MEDDVINELAKAGYQSYFDDDWESLNPRGVEVALWKQVAGEMLKKWNEINGGSMKPIPPGPEWPNIKI